MLIPLGILDFPVAAGSYDLLETEILTGTQASVTFSSLGDYASDYQHLQIRLTGRGTDAATGVTGNYLRFNGDSGANYSLHILFGNGSSVASTAETSSTWALAGLVASGGMTASSFTGTVIDILDPFETTKYTTTRALTGIAANSSRIDLHSGSWRNTNALTSIEILMNSISFATGSRFSLYGLKVA